MKRRFIQSLFVLVLLSFHGFAIDGKIYSYGPDGKNFFTEANDRILVQFTAGLSFDQKAEILAKEAGLKLDSKDVLPAPDVSIVKVNGLDSEGIHRLLVRLNTLNSIEYANPFVIYEDGTYQGIQNRIIVRLKSDKDFGLLTNIAKGLNLNVVEKKRVRPANVCTSNNKADERQCFGHCEQIDRIKRFRVRRA